MERNEAIEIVKKNWPNDGFTRLREALETLIPELKESEDEKTIKFIANELACIRATDEKGTCRYEELTKAIDWLEKQGEQTSSQTNERAWLYLVADVLTWKDGIGQYLDNPRVQELAKKLCNEYSQKLYESSVISNPTNTGKNEKAHVNKVEPKFKIGDWVVSPNGVYWYIYAIRDGRYQVCANTGEFADWPLDTNLYHRFTIQDAKDGDVLACNEEILLFKSYSVQGRISLYCWYNGQTNNFHSKEVSDTLLTTRNKICPATKEQRDLLFQKMKEAGYEWDAELKQLRKIDQKYEEKPLISLKDFQDAFELKAKQYDIELPHRGYDIHAMCKELYSLLIKQNSAWSKEDEEFLDSALWHVKNSITNGKVKAFVECPLSNWLKSLKDRYAWKPTNEQLEALDSATENCAYSEYQDCLRELIGQLKKLKEV